MATARKPKEGRAGWVNRITRYVPAVDPTSINPHPNNWRRHPDYQKSALTEALERIGWVGVVLVNERTGNALDGHLRLEDAIDAGELVPVLYVDIDPEMEDAVLATFDPITMLATGSADTLADLLSRVQVATPELDQLLQVLAEPPAPLRDRTGGDGDEPPGERDFWPRLVVQVPPALHTRFLRAYPDGDDQSDAVVAALDAHLAATPS